MLGRWFRRKAWHGVDRHHRRLWNGIHGGRPPPKRGSRNFPSICGLQPHLPAMGGRGGGLLGVEHVRRAGHWQHQFYRRPSRGDGGRPGFRRPPERKDGRTDLGRGALHLRRPRQRRPGLLGLGRQRKARNRNHSQRRRRGERDGRQPQRGGSGERADGGEGSRRFRHRVRHTG